MVPFELGRSMMKRPEETSPGHSAKSWRRALTALALILGTAAYAGADPIVFVASTGNSPPLNIVENGRLTEGIVKDVGDAIAKRLGLAASYISLPRKRIEKALAAGDADSVCYGQPEWYSLPLDWSRPFIPNTGVIVSNAHAAPLARISDLRGQVLGTVFGFFYPQIDAVSRSMQ
jgi:ABC-type amino acid transport substrate-binding protein